MSNLFNPPNKEKLNKRIAYYEQPQKSYYGIGTIQAAREAFNRGNLFYAEELVHHLDWKFS